MCCFFPPGRFTVPADRRLLVSTMESDDLVVTTSLVKWYIDHGLDVTVLSFVEYRGQRCFQRFTDWVTEARRSSKTGQLGQTCKLIGNAAYGALLTDQTRFTRTLYMADGERAEATVLNPLFKKMDKLSAGFFEVQLGKSQVAMSLPNQLGVTVLAHAKESLLNFFFNHLDHYVPRDLLSVISIDTDAIYCSLASEDIDDLVRPHLRNEYRDAIYGQCRDGPVTPGFGGVGYFPRLCCPRHEARDRTCPLFYKKEYHGYGGIALNPKTSIFHGASTTEGLKFSCKGLQRSRLTEHWQRYLAVLRTRETDSVRNVSFRCFGNSVYTYAQTRRGLLHEYWKRELMEDMVSTVSLKL
jgi:hypothetical protein